VIVHVTGFKPGEVVKAYERWGDYLSPQVARGRGDALAEATADEAGDVEFDIATPGLPLWVVGPGFQRERAVKCAVPGEWSPEDRRNRRVPQQAARQTATASVNENALSDELPDRRSTRVFDARNPTRPTVPPAA
jgi:hypothetical protein